MVCVRSRRWRITFVQRVRRVSWCSDIRLGTTHSLLFMESRARGVLNSRSLSLQSSLRGSPALIYPAIFRGKESYRKSRLYFLYCLTDNTRDFYEGKCYLICVEYIKLMFLARFVMTGERRYCACYLVRAWYDEIRCSSSFECTTIVAEFDRAHVCLTFTRIALVQYLSSAGENELTRSYW